MASSTFAGDEHAVGGTQLRRYLLMWLGTTAGQHLVAGRDRHGLGRGWAWLAETRRSKLVLGVVGFLLSRHWVYRK